jgi:hypothetical protein
MVDQPEHVDQPELIVVREYRIREGCLPQGGGFRVLFDIVKKRSIRALDATAGRFRLRTPTSASLTACRRVGLEK